MIRVLAAVVVGFGLCLAEAVTGFAVGSERDALRGLHAAVSPALDPSMRQVSRFGGGLGVAVVGAVVLAGLLVSRRTWTAVVFAVSVAGASTSPLIKILVRRPRPRLWPAADQLSDWSFPSGHAASSAALVAGLVALAWSTRWRWPTAVIGTVLVTVVGLSRLVLGVHYPSDVVGGWSLAVGWVIGVHLIARRLPPAGWTELPRG